MFFELHASLVKSWFELAEIGSKALSEASANATRLATSAMCDAMKAAVPAPSPVQYAFPFAPAPLLPGTFFPLQSLMLSAPWAWPLAAPAFNTPAMWPGAYAMPMSFGLPSRAVDPFAMLTAAFRPAGAQPFPAAMLAPFFAPPTPWWARPADRGWLH